MFNKFKMKLILKQSNRKFTTKIVFLQNINMLKGLTEGKTDQMADQYKQDNVENGLYEQQLMDMMAELNLQLLGMKKVEEGFRMHKNTQLQFGEQKIMLLEVRMLIECL